MTLIMRVKSIKLNSKARRDKGLCLYCNDTSILGHCPTKEKNLFRLMVRIVKNEAQRRKIMIKMKSICVIQCYFLLMRP